MSLLCRRKPFLDSLEDFLYTIFKMWLEQIARNLELAKQEPRHFCLCLSGGLDSTVMAHALHELKKSHQISLQAIHLHYGLRGRSSDLDAQAVRALCKKLDIPLEVHLVEVDKTAGIQNQARSLRLKAISHLPSQVEILEAHHQDDQVETFFLNLFRGAGLKGLASLNLKSTRQNRRVWRPLLTMTKQELSQVARRARMRWREDQSNRSTAYDRNFLRLRILPLIEKRFPFAHRSVVSTIHLLQAWEFDAARDFETKCFRGDLLLSDDPLTLNLSVIASWSNFERLNFFYYLFAQKLRIQVSREVLQELSDACLQKPAVSVNLPKSIVARIRARRRLVLDGLKGVLGDDKMPIGIILKRDS